MSLFTPHLGKRGEGAIEIDQPTRLALIDMDWIGPHPDAFEPLGRDEWYLPNDQAISYAGDDPEHILAVLHEDFADVLAAARLVVADVDRTPEPAKVNVSTVHAAVLAMFPDAELGEDNDGQLIVYTGLTNVEYATTEMARGRFVKPQPVIGPTPEDHVRLVVLDDGDTYSGMEGCKIVDISEEDMDCDDAAYLLRDLHRYGDKVHFVARFNENGLEV